MTKICNKCHIEKDVTEFHKNKVNEDGFQHRCKSCKKKYDVEWRKHRDKTIERNSNYKRKYGITIEDYNKMFEEQHGCCVICGRHQTEMKEILAVEHSHETGKVRGLVCNRCNIIIGFFEDYPQLIITIKNYIGMSEQEWKF
jgi:hypothetical protein